MPLSVLVAANRLAATGSFDPEITNGAPVFRKFLAAIGISLRAPAATLGRGGVALASVVGVVSCTGIDRQQEPAVVVWVSDTTPGYTRVVSALQRQLPMTTRVVQFNGDQQRAQAARRELTDDDAPIVAIGALALEQARQLPRRRVVFCQVFHYEQPGLLTASTFGVKPMPPLAKQFHAWKLLDPALTRVALITGPGLRDLPAEAQRAGTQMRLDVRHVVVQSDKELLYTVRDRLAGVQGIWLAPDHRVLSRETLRDVLAHAVRQGMTVMVFDRRLLDFGALASAEGDQREVAERVVELLRRPPNAGPRVVALERTRVSVNSQVAARLGLTTPPIFRRGAHVF